MKDERHDQEVIKEVESIVVEERPLRGPRKACEISAGFSPRGPRPPQNNSLTSFSSLYPFSGEPLQQFSSLASELASSA